MKCIFATWFSIIFFCLQTNAQFTQFKYPNGNISSEGLMVDGKPNGYWKTFYEDGGLKTEGNRLNFLLDSTWKFYRSDSTLERIITYREDLKNGPEQYFSPDGILKEEFTYHNNIKDGLAKIFYDSGKIQKEIPFENNKEEGKGYEYAEDDGRIITATIYKNGFIYGEEIINRYNSSGKRTGIWKDLHANGLVKEEGNYTNGQRNGVFKFFTRKGELEKIEVYENGMLKKDDAQVALLDIRKEFYENGKLKLEGSYRDGKKNGTFRSYDENGNQSGALIYENNVVLAEGQLDSLGRRQGPWKIYYPDGVVRAEGGYINGLKDGPWVYFFNSKKIEQKGSYKEDLPYGNWQWFYADGQLHRDEYYRRGKEDGHAVEYDSLGVVINEGDFVDGLKSGLWKLSVNDHTEQGEYLDGELNGEWVWYYGNGQKAFEGEFQVGTPIGKHKYWYSNGTQKMRGEYDGGELDGRWDYFREDGTLDLYIEYKGGLAVKINGQKIKLPKPKEEQ